MNAPWSRLFARSPTSFDDVLCRSRCFIRSEKLLPPRIPRGGMGYLAMTGRNVMKITHAGCRYGVSQNDTVRHKFEILRARGVE
jgi:hypothetical protein